MNKIRVAVFSIFIYLWVFISPCSLSCCASEIDQAEETKNTKLKIERHFVFDSIPMNLEEITNAADRIFAGRCIKVEEIENDLESKLPVIKYTFKVTEGVKGVTDGEEVRFKQWKPTVREAGYEVGKKYVLFLYPNSKKGLTSPVGFQGKFDVETTGIIRRKEVVKNNFNNKGLSRNLKTQKKVSIERDKFINDYIHRCSELGIPMRYKEFVKAVRYLVEE